MHDLKQKIQLKYIYMRTYKFKIWNNKNQPNKEEAFLKSNTVDNIDDQSSCGHTSNSLIIFPTSIYPLHRPLISTIPYIYTPGV